MIDELQIIEMRLYGSKAVRLVILGGPGSGTSTLGHILSLKLSVPHFEGDAIVWEGTAGNPYYRKRPSEERVELLQTAVVPQVSWVISGSLGRWGDLLLSRTTGVVFLDVDRAERLNRLRVREASRFGTSILPNNKNYGRYLDFLRMAAAYERGPYALRRHRLEDLEWFLRARGHKLYLDGLSTPNRIAETVCSKFKLEVGANSPNGSARQTESTHYSS